MRFLGILKCVLCPRWSCSARYSIGSREYYSHLGFVKTECPRTLEKDPEMQYIKHINDQITEMKLQRLKSEIKEAIEIEQREEE